MERVFWENAAAAPPIKRRQTAGQMFFGKNKEKRQNRRFASFLLFSEILRFARLRRAEG
ncbi:MAG TPA: hypothetical protein H9851_06820 [Candidatus Borkfalkia faecavium]|uniref:Uncharacterized protein n=1 Tax=Candidatus Borkfalkia faecavium TaxID=2838508 RepID=A0A9D1W2A5_9FIRM|nr:hypothetical protein [Candidatus Borkfalkia faecavium]